jgi:predicted permease
MDALLHDLRYAVRSLRSTPGFTAVAVLTLAFGIGANTAVFTLLNGLVLRALPVRDPQQLVEPLFKYPKDPRLNNYSWRNYERLRDDNHVFSDVMAISPARLQVIHAGGAGQDVEAVDGAYVSANFFEALGVRPAVGRSLDTPGDRGTGVLVTWSYWQSRFHSDRSIVGRTLVVNDATVTIAGVLPREFSGLEPGMPLSLWLPVDAEPMTQKPSRFADGSLRVQIVARLKPGVTMAQAQTEARVIDQARLTENEARGHDVQWRQAVISLEPAGTGLSTLRDLFSSVVLLMTATASILLLVACINVASMLLARTAAKRRDIAVRVALGAGRARIVREILAEALILSTAASVAGLWIAYVGARALVNLIASGRPPVGWQRLEIPAPLDWHVLLFACGAGVLTGVAFGVAPAWRSATSHAWSGLRQTDAKQSTRFGAALVVAQVALSVVLLNAGALFVRHLMDLRTVGVGFDTDSVLQVRLDWSRTGYKPPQIAAVYRQLLDRVSAIAGVRSATVAGMTPISGAGASRFITVPGFTEDPDARRRVTLNDVGPKYFETLGTPLISGRDFSADDEAGPRVAIVNQAMARYYFGASNPIGRQFTIEGLPDLQRPLEIVGVVADAKYGDLHETPPRTIYMDIFQGGPNGGLLVARMARASVAADVQRALRDVAPTVPIRNVTTLADQVNASILPERMIASLSALFGVAAAILVAMGLYGLLAYSVARRVKEIGIRIAIGASRADVIQMVVRRALGMVLAGLVVGVPFALWTRGYATFVLGLVAATKLDVPVTLPTAVAGPLVAAATAMIVVALAAACLPARRAARVDPMIALRTE